MYKIKSLFWPCRVINNSENEIVTIKVYDDVGTTLDVEACKLKSFEILTRIPRSRMAEWRRAYERAVNNED